MQKKIDAFHAEYLCDLPVPLLAAVDVFIPEFLSISMSSQRNALISCLISFTSSSVTPSFSALRCSTVTYRLTKFLMILWYLKSRSEACLTFRWDKRIRNWDLSASSFHYKVHYDTFYVVCPKFVKLLHYLNFLNKKSYLNPLLVKIRSVTISYCGLLL